MHLEETSNWHNAKIWYNICYKNITKKLQARAWIYHFLEWTLVAIHCLTLSTACDAFQDTHFLLIFASQMAWPNCVYKDFSLFIDEPMIPW